MINLSIWKKAWALLEYSQRRYAGFVLAIVVATALFAAVMVGSILPFLTVLADPSSIQTSPALAWLYGKFGFSSIDGFLMALGLGSLSVILFASAAQICRAYAIEIFTSRQIESLSTRLFANYLQHPYTYFLDRHTGDMGTQILTVSQQVVDRFFRPAAEIVAATCSSIAVLILVFWISPAASLASLAVLGGIYGMTYLLTRRRIARLARQSHAAHRARYRISVEALGGIKAIKVLNRESTYIERFKIPAREVAHSQAVTGLTAEVPNYVLQALAFGGIVALALVLLGTSDGDVQSNLGGILPIVGLFAFAGQRLLPELHRIYAGVTHMQQGRITVEAVFTDLIENRSQKNTTPEDVSPMGLRKSVTFDHVDFKYPNTDQAGLLDVSFTIHLGERVGVVGTTGAGKSTLADILLGLMPAQNGSVAVDGVKLDAGNFRSWQKSLGYVPQDIFLVDASIRENIALGSKPEEIDEKRVAEACRIAQLNDFIKSEIPNGLDSMIGERGVRLSGGQKQRIGIARAIYQQFDLLILDEATSALDNITEKAVLAAIDALPSEKSVVMIAHRLSTVRNCDRILLLDNGRLVANGSWGELQESSALFREMTRGHVADTRDSAP